MNQRGTGAKKGRRHRAEARTRPAMPDTRSAEPGSVLVGSKSSPGSVQPARASSPDFFTSSQAVSRGAGPSQWAPGIFRDLYNGAWAHGAPGGRTPAMAMRLTDHLWTVLEYITYPVHADDLKREIWAEERREVLTSALEREKPRKTLPTS